MACGGATSPTSPPPKHVDAPNTIIGTRVEGTSKELLAKGENALLAQRWQEAVDAFEAVIAGDPAAANDPRVLYDLGLAYEGLGDREKARTRYREVSRRFPTDAIAKHALAREASLDAYLEDWVALGEVGATILARTDIDPAEKMLGLGARALARLQAKDETGASRDIHDGLDLIDEHRYGMTGQLPVAAAMLKFANGELRRMRSEKISLNPPGDDFLQKLEARCALLLEAQAAYADAIRSIDLHWAAMSGYRVGEMYRTLHHHLMLIPPTASKAKTESDRQLFYAIMHVRYRVLLEKGVEMMKRTLALGDRIARETGTPLASAWMKRAEAAKADMERAIEDEKAVIAKYPYTEEEVQKALEILKKKMDADAAKGAKK
jgi:tetratricopeptide (TPR) repeat protein